MYCGIVVSLVAQRLKRLPATWEPWVRSLGQEDPLVEEMATHSSILALENPMDRGAWWATVHGVSKNRTLKLLSTHSCCGAGVQGVWALVVGTLGLWSTGSAIVVWA